MNLRENKGEDVGKIGGGERQKLCNYILTSKSKGRNKRRKQLTKKSK